jgi:hypothetical protein
MREVTEIRDRTAKLLAGMPEVTSNAESEAVRAHAVLLVRECDNFLAELTGVKRRIH